MTPHECIESVNGFIWRPESVPNARCSLSVRARPVHLQLCNSGAGEGAAFNRIQYS